MSFVNLNFWNVASLGLFVAFALFLRRKSSKIEETFYCHESCITGRIKAQSKIVKRHKCFFCRILSLFRWWKLSADVNVCPFSNYLKVSVCKWFQLWAGDEQHIIRASNFRFGHCSYCLSFGVSINLFTKKFDWQASYIFITTTLNSFMPQISPWFTVYARGAIVLHYSLCEYSLWIMQF